MFYSVLSVERPIVSFIFPSYPSFNFVIHEANNLIIGRVEQDHPDKDPLCLLETTEAPKAETIPEHAAKEPAIVDESPMQHTVDVRSKRKFADAQAHLVVAERHYEVY